MTTESRFYLGRHFDLAAGETTQDEMLYDPDDLTTHAVVVGMTGSGKTGLCLDMLEEAALQRIPALMIDPKGDITNALLHFPDLAAADFEPWIDRNEAKREGKQPSAVAAETAELWRTGLAKWGVDPERIAQLKGSVRFSIFSPGSSAGIPVSILSSLKAPELPWESHQDLIRERISGTATAILGLVGFKDVDPVRSREHILLANIFERTWSQGKDLSLADLIMQVQSPPFEKLGVFDVNTFFPEKDRLELAMFLNNILASPGFESWLDGVPLDVGQLLYTGDGRPRHSIFYIAHLNDEERMFFVSLLFSAVETWMRAQRGSTSLRALLYFDEISGYLPPVGNPPSKETMLRMLKQARAFGVGLILATQNPVDIDYKALSNTGSWFIGKLQTDQDKQRLLDGLAGAAGALDLSQYDALLSGLGNRVFLLHNVHESEPILFQTRWAMNYLAGPMTRAQIPALNALAGVAQPPAEATRPPAGTVGRSDTRPAGPKHSKHPTESTSAGVQTRPAVPSSLNEYFLPQNLTLSEAAKAGDYPLDGDDEPFGILYKPALLAQADVRFDQSKYKVTHDQRIACLVIEPDRRGMLLWDNYLVPPIDPRALDRAPVPEAQFIPLETPLVDTRIMKSLERDFEDWIYRTAQIEVRANDTLKVYGGPELTEEAYLRMAEEVADELHDIEAKKLKDKFEQKLDRLKDKLRREERELKEDEAEYNQRKREESVSHAETLISLFSGRRRSLSSSLSKRRMTERAKADVEESEEMIEELEAEIRALQDEIAESLEELEEKWDDIATGYESIAVSAYKKDIHLSLFGVAWYPFHLVKAGRQMSELPAFSANG